MDVLKLSALRGETTFSGYDVCAAAVLLKGEPFQSGVTDRTESGADLLSPSNPISDSTFD